jgi:hypothetical protein
MFNRNGRAWDLTPLRAIAAFQSLTREGKEDNLE